MRLDIIPERPCLPVGEVTSLPVLIRLTAPTVPQMARKPLNLCLVIDRSGSMANEKLRQTIASARFVVERLAPTDILSVVQFDERVKVVLPPGFVTDKAHLCRRLDGIHDGGQTNLSGGWLRGAACVREKKTPEYINRVILLTDGQANHGIVDPAALVKHAAELTEEGITTTTIGYGEDFNEDLLTVLTHFPLPGFHFAFPAVPRPSAHYGNRLALCAWRLARSLPAARCHLPAVLLRTPHPPRREGPPSRHCPGGCWRREGRHSTAHGLPRRARGRRQHRSRASSRPPPTQGDPP